MEGVLDFLQMAPHSLQLGNNCALLSKDYCRWLLVLPSKLSDCVAVSDM
jgi:hypothetical protein